MAIPGPLAVTSDGRAFKFLIGELLENGEAFVTHFLRLWTFSAGEFLNNFFLGNSNNVSASTHTTLDFRLGEKVA